jgi:hypothetical protein
MFGTENFAYRIFRQSYLFFATLLAYLAMRFMLLGKPVVDAQKNFYLADTIKKILFNWYQAVKPFLGLQNASKGVAFFVALLFVGALIFAFVQNRNIRKELTFCVFSFFLLAWPISFVTSDGRYFYPAIPIFIFMLYIITMNISQKISAQYRNITVMGTILALSTWGAWHGVNALISRSFVTHQRDKAFECLAKNYENIPNLRLIMVGTLHCFNHDTLFMQQGMTQAARLFFNNPDLEAYHVTQAKIFSYEKAAQSFYITPLGNGFRFTSPDPENLFFMIPHSWPEEKPIPFSMGTIVVHKKSAPWKAPDISFVFDEKWIDLAQKKRTKFVTFDLGRWTFRELNIEEKI